VASAIERWTSNRSRSKSTAVFNLTRTSKAKRCNWIAHYLLELFGVLPDFGQCSCDCGRSAWGRGQSCAFCYGVRHAAPATATPFASA